MCFLIKVIYRGEVDYDAEVILKVSVSVLVALYDCKTAAVGVSVS